MTTVSISDYYEQTGSTIRKYYYAGGVRIAERIGGTLYYLLTDHLGSTAVTTDANGAYVTELRYMPYGKPRYDAGNQKADYRFTGQREERTIGVRAQRRCAPTTPDGMTRRWRGSCRRIR